MKAIIRRGKVTGKPISALAYNEENIEWLAKKSKQTVQQVKDAFDNKEGVGGDLSQWFLEDWANPSSLQNLLLQ